MKLITVITGAVRITLAATLLAIASGCSTPAGVIAARRNFYTGNQDRALACLTNLPPDAANNKVLMLMERGMIHQARSEYGASAADWQQAITIAKQLDYYSLSKGSASYVVNDNAMAFYGAPYERTLLHAFNAQNYLAQAKWDDAAVEARNIVRRLKDLNGFPDDPFSRYVSAFCFEMAGDADGARFEYKHLDGLLPNGITVNEQTGQLSASAGDKKEERPPNRAHPRQKELVCFIFSGHVPSEYDNYNPGLIWRSDPYAELYAGDKCLGRSYVLANTGRLLVDTERRLAAMKITKEVTRLVIKEAIAEAISRKNELLGELTRIILFSLEEPDLRRWETLPLTLQVARVPCPDDLKDFKVVFKDQSGWVQKEKRVTAPITRRGNTYVSFCRDL